MGTNDKHSFFLDHLPISVSCFCCLEVGLGSVEYSTQVVCIFQDGFVITSPRKLRVGSLLSLKLRVPPEVSGGPFWGESVYGWSCRSRAIAQGWGTQIQSPDRNCRAIRLENQPGNSGRRNPRTRKFFNINICRNNTQDVRQLTEYAREHRIATDYHINETPMLEPDDHFKHLFDNPTYIRPDDWRMSSGVDLKRSGWYGDGLNENNNQTQVLASIPGIRQEASGELRFAEWGCRAGQNNVVIRTDGTVTPCFPMYPSSIDWGNIDKPKFDEKQLAEMKKTCQQHCFSTLNHNLAHCYNDARVIKWLWSQAVKNRFQGGARSFDD